jgi:hypothetical protein
LIARARGDQCHRAEDSPAAAVVFTAGALVSTSSSAFADLLEGAPLSGEENTDQTGAQNLACGNSARLVRLNVAETVNRERVCVDDDGHTRRDSTREGGTTQATGGTTLGPQLNTAQSGKQNLSCGNSADLVTVNVLGTMNWDTTCMATDYGNQDGSEGYGEYTAGARTQGGTTVGPQVNTAQTGRQNLYCGNSSDTLTVKVAGTIRKYTTCTPPPTTPLPATPTAAVLSPTPAMWPGSRPTLPRTAARTRPAAVPATASRSPSARPNTEPGALPWTTAEHPVTPGGPPRPAPLEPTTRLTSLSSVSRGCMCHACCRGH